MAAEVALQQLRGIRDELFSEGDSLDDWLADAQLPKFEWSDLEYRLAWADYAHILDIVCKHRSPKWLTRMGEQSIDDEQASLFRSGLLLGFDRPGLALEWMCSPLGPFSAVNPFLDNTLQRNSELSYTLRSMMKSGLAPSRNHHLFAQGVLQAFPLVLFERPATIQMQWTDEGAEYQIKFASPTLLGRFKRRRQRSQPQPEYLAGIGATYLELVDRQSQLQQQQTLVRKAEAAALVAEKQDSLGFLTSGVAHDFRNLLTVAQGQLELVLDKVDDSARESIEQVLKTCQQGSDLTERLLAYAREAPSTPVDLDVKEVLSSVLPILEKGLGSKGDLRVNLPDVPQKIHVERGQLENALLNLVVNAGDALQASGLVEISCKDIEISPESCLAQECEPGKFIMIRVEDNGSGIDPELVRHVFDPYFTTKPKGTGLGLSSVWGFVKQNGGHVTLSSAPMQGSRFDLYLPKH